MISIKGKISYGYFWNSINIIAGQAIQFLINIILARILLPSEFGTIGMLSIFMAISQTLVDSSLGLALIQKKDVSELDYSTVFIFNLIISIIIYLFLYLLAPQISRYFNAPKLKEITRILTLIIIINSVAIVPKNKLIKNIQFKEIAKNNIITTILSGIIAIIAARYGIGVWSLVIQNLSRSILSSILYFINSNWNISIKFSIQSFKSLFKFSSKLLISGLLSSVFNEFNNLAIGKYYSSTDLGYYTRAKTFVYPISDIVTNVVIQSSYPILVNYQDQKEKMLKLYTKNIKFISFIMFPIMVLIAIVTRPFVILVLTNKWISISSIMVYLCIARILSPINSLNMNIMNVIGRSDYFLKEDMLKNVFIIIGTIISIPFGVKAVVFSQIFISIISFFINTYMPGKLFGYGPYKQIKDMLPFLIFTCIAALVTIIIKSFIKSQLIKIVASIVLFSSIYFLLGKIFKIGEFDYSINEIKNIIKLSKKKQ